MPSPSEFPTDNPSLFTARPPSVFPTAPALDTTPAPPAAFDDRDDRTDAPAARVAPDDTAVGLEVVDGFDEAFFAALDAEASEAPAEARTAVDVYLDALCATAREAGASDELVGLLPGLLGYARLDATGASEQTVQRLVATGLATRVGASVVRDEATANVALAWREALLDRDPDLAACGGAMFDEWSAKLVARLAGCPERTEALRKTLRTRGVAAFGLLIDAA